MSLKSIEAGKEGIIDCSDEDGDDLSEAMGANETLKKGAKKTAEVKFNSVVPLIVVSSCIFSNRLL